MSETGVYRCISDHLLWKYRGQPERIVALLELDRDHFKRAVRPTREYARLWGVSRMVARTLVSEYRAFADRRTERENTTKVRRTHQQECKKPSGPVKLLKNSGVTSPAPEGREPTTPEQYRAARERRGPPEGAPGAPVARATGTARPRALTSEELGSVRALTAETQATIARITRAQEVP